MQASLIIITKDRPEVLATILACAATAMPDDGEVIVVDGDPERSAQGVVQEVRAGSPQLDLRYLTSEPGMTRQRNAGIDAARGDVVVFVDDDCTFERGFFEALRDAYRDPTVLGVTGRISAPAQHRLGSTPDSRLRWLILGGGPQGTMSAFGFRRPILDQDRPRDVEFMPGPLMSARREVAAEVRFDERLPGYSLGEDDDFSYRVSRRGRVLFDPSVRVFHQEIGARNNDDREMDRRQVLDRTYLFRKNFPQTLTARIRFVALLVLLCGHRVLNFEWSGLRGLLEGIRQADHSDRHSGPDQDRTDSVAVSSDAEQGLHSPRPQRQDATRPLAHARGEDHWARDGEVSQAA